MNRNSDYAIPTEKEMNMDGYDELPKEVRTCLQNACMIITNSSALRVYKQYGIGRLQYLLNDLVGKNARAAYGPDHPQAQ